MNACILILIVAFLTILLMALLLQDQNNYLSYRRVSNFINGSIDLPGSFDIETIGNSILESRLGNRIVLKFFLSVILILLVSILILGPLLTNAHLGMVLGLIIAAAYILRVYYHLALDFRNKILLQLEGILRSIRNQLSSGATLDYAVLSVLNYVRQELPIGQDLTRFVQSTETNFFESFPLWLKSLQNKYNLAELSEASQLLALELQYANNQEQAFLIAMNSINSRLTFNKRSQNTIFVTFLSLDFMVFAFFGVLFYVIPSFAFSADLDWWSSSRREWIVFISGAVLWLAYFAAVAFTSRRLA